MSWANHKDPPFFANVRRIKIAVYAEKSLLLLNNSNRLKLHLKAQRLSAKMMNLHVSQNKSPQISDDLSVWEFMFY